MQRPSRRIFAEALVMLIALVPALLWPGDTLWTNDEPRLLANAWHANQAWHPAWGGLWGNFGIRYGPFPTQFYQFLLSLTHDPLLLAMLRAGICASVSAGSLLWLARSAGLSPWFAGAALAAPLVVHFHRLMWDASFAMPLGALALASLAAYLRRGRVWCLVLSIVSTAFFATIHPQDLPLAAAIGGMLAWSHRPALRVHRKPLLIALAVFLALNGVFFVQLAHLIFTRLGGAVSSGYPGGESPGIALLAPFLGGNLLGGESSWRTPGAVDAWMRLQAAIIYPLCWAGIGIAALCASGRGRCPVGTALDPTAATRRDIMVVALATVVMQGLLFAVMRVPSGAQYFFGTFAVHIFLAWLAVESLPRPWLRFACTAAYGVACGWLSLHALWLTHRDGSAIEPLQPTLGSQAELARTLNRAGARSIFTDVAHLQNYAQGVRALRLLLPPAEADSAPRLLVRYRSGRRGEFDVSEMSAPSEQPEGFSEVDVTPLPEGWYPGLGK
ncbi:MAG: hypothetical protein ABMA01_18710 [Chthoniobacteraceae bacterium]